MRRRVLATTGAGPSALPGVRPRGSNQSVQDSGARLVVPQLEDLAAQLTTAQLQSVRTQVAPGERVALYQGERWIRVLIVAPDRLHRVAPARLAGGWRCIGTVEITDDGERSLPVVLS